MARTTTFWGLVRLGFGLGSLGWLGSMAIGCNSVDHPPVIDPAECLPGHPCPKPGGGTVSGGGTAGTGGAGGSSGTGGTGGIGGSSGSGGTGGGDSITGIVTVFDNELLTTTTLLAQSTIVEAQTTTDVYNRASAWSGTGTYSLDDIAIPSFVFIKAPPGFLTLNGLGLVSSDGANELTTVARTTLEDLLFPADYLDMIGPLLPDVMAAQILVRFKTTVGDPAGVSVNAPKGSQGVGYLIDGEWVIVDPEEFPPPTPVSTDASGLVYIVNYSRDGVGAVAPPPNGELAKIFYTVGVEDPISLNVQVASDTLTVIDINISPR